MTSATVTNSVSYYRKAVGQGAGSISAPKQDFTQVMSKAANAEQKTQSKEVHTPKKKYTNAARSESSNAVKDRLTNKEAGRKEISTDNTAFDQEQLSAKTVEMLGEISEKLGVSEEELLSAMEMLGMQMTDLLNPESMAQLMLEVMGETDMLSLVMDETQCAKFNDLLKTLKQALAELQSAKNEVSGEADEMAEMPKANAEPQKEVVLQDGTKAENADEKVSKPPETADTEEPVTVTLKTDQKTDKEQMSATAQTGRTEEAPKDEALQSAVAEEEDEPLQKTSRQQDAEKTQPLTADKEKPLEVGKENSVKQETGEKDNNPSFLQSFMNKATQTAQAIAAPQTLETADTESIMKQILDYTRQHMRADITELEIKLQPANLGNINIQVAAKNGVVTAQISAETEAVRKAIETQVVQLRENLNEQGIKIEAVEVTIASHEFERNLDQGGQSAESEEAQTDKKTGRRRLVLSELDEEAEAELEDSEQIQVQMMKQSGNSVNMTA